jgi:hypothetical protein
MTARHRTVVLPFFPGFCDGAVFGGRWVELRQLRDIGRDAPRLVALSLLS